MKKDNSTLSAKVSLRISLLKLVKKPKPFILETHGGFGGIYERCYFNFPGVVFEKDGEKISYLAKQRPEWAIYEGDSLPFIPAAFEAFPQINLVDIDPYGDPWPFIAEVIRSAKVKNLALVVNDGLRQKLVMGAWDVASVQEAVMHFGNKLADNYIDVIGWLLNKKATEAGYRLNRFTAYYTGFNKQMTHYAALLTTKGLANPS